MTAREQNFIYKEQVKNPTELAKHIGLLRAEAPQNVSEHKQGVIDSVISNFLRGNDQTANSLLDKITARVSDEELAQMTQKDKERLNELGRISQAERKKLVDAVLEHREAYADELRDAIEKAGVASIAKTELGQVIEKALHEDLAPEPAEAPEPPAVDSMPSGGSGKGDALPPNKKRPRIEREFVAVESDTPGNVAHFELSDSDVLDPDVELPKPTLGDPLIRRKNLAAKHIAREEQLNYLAEAKASGNLDNNVVIDRKSEVEVTERAKKIAESEEFGLSEEDLSGMSITEENTLDDPAIFEKALSEKEGEEYTFSHEDQKGYLWFNRGTNKDRVKISKTALQKILQQQTEVNTSSKESPMPEKPNSTPEETLKPVAADGADVVVDLDADEAGATSADEVVPAATEKPEPTDEEVAVEVAVKDGKAEVIEKTTDSTETEKSPEKVGEDFQKELNEQYAAFDDERVLGKPEEQKSILNKMLQIRKEVEERDDMLYLSDDREHPHPQVVYPGRTMTDQDGNKVTVVEVLKSADQIIMKDEKSGEKRVYHADELTARGVRENKFTEPIEPVAASEVTEAEEKVTTITPEPLTESTKINPEYILDMSDVPPLVQFDPRMTDEELDRALEQNKQRMAAIEKKEREYNAFLRGGTATPEPEKKPAEKPERKEPVSTKPAEKGPVKPKKKKTAPTPPSTIVPSTPPPPPTTPEASTGTTPEATPEKKDDVKKKKRKLMNRGSRKSREKRKEGERRAYDPEAIIKEAMPFDTLFDETWDTEQQRSFYRGRSELFMKETKPGEFPIIPRNIRELADSRPAIVGAINYLNEHWTDKEMDLNDIRELLGRIPPINEEAIMNSGGNPFTEKQLDTILTNLEKFHGLPIDEE